MDLPIDRIVAAVRQHRAAVITAPPGAGKTTRVPPALAEDGPVLLLQPRRVAARAIARYIAQQQRWTLGREVGWQVRFERRFSAHTRLLVATEGILTARLQDDPLLTAFRTVIIDEFHERSIHADVGLALAREAWRARPDLRLVVMSATLDAARVAAYLDDAPVIDVASRLYPIEIVYRPKVSVEDAVIEAVHQTRGAVLCFLPGASEIRRTLDALAPRLSGVAIVPLHGSLDADEQDVAMTPTAERRVILATNIAETTLTVPDVTCVVDAGTHKVARYDAERAIDSLVLERISQDSADQRAGRAGRTAPGLALRLWDPRDRLRPHREPEIARVDLASTVLDVLAWGGDPRTLGWFDAPPESAVAAAFALLRRLGALDDGGPKATGSIPMEPPVSRPALVHRITPRGRVIRRLPLHPRLATLLIETRGAPEAARACALLSERSFVPPRTAATSCDLLSAVEREHLLPPHVVRTAREIRHSLRHAIDGSLADRVDETAFRRAVLAAYPDRVARRRSPQGDRLVLSSGTGARLSRDSGVHDGEYLVASDVTAGQAGPRSMVRRSKDPRLHATAGEALVRLATRVDREWLAATSSDVRYDVDDHGAVHAWRVDRYDQLILAEHPIAPEPDRAREALAAEYVRRPRSDRDEQFLRRLRFAGVQVSVDDLIRAGAQSARRFDDIQIEDALRADQRRLLDRHAPLTLSLPNGRRARLDYRDDGRVVAAVKLQDLFGVVETPMLGPNRMPVTFELLAPNGRPVQVTQDLRSFWARGYPEVRKQLRGRYPKHRWPEDPFV